MSDSAASSKSNWLGRVRKVDRYFLEEKNPFSHKRTFKMKNVKIAAGGIIAVTVLLLLFVGDRAEKAEFKAASVAVRAEDVPARGSSSPHSNEGSIAVGSGWNQGQVAGTISLGGSAGYTGGTSRQYSASQIVRGGEGVGNGFGLPMGSTVAARLVNSLLSSDSSQPVIAEIVEDAVWRNSVLIPAGTKAIGTASFDDAAKRLQIRFQTFVYPEGDQHPVSALALLQNGSSGLPGDYHSGATQKEVGRFLGNFVGGLADGMKERQVGAQGMAFEPGSLKNGILNGITVSALDQGKAFSEGMQNVRPYLEVQGGTPFLLYFEKEYSP